MNEDKLKSDDSRNPDYRSQLIKTQKVFEDMGQELFTCLINVSMSGELRSADDFEVGEVLNFNESDFRNLDDQNVHLIFKVLDVIHTSRATMININNLDSASEEGDTPF